MSLDRFVPKMDIEPDDCPGCNELRAALAAERERADKAEKALLVPGEMRCAKCKFTLIRTNLYVKSGTTGPGGSETEPCPNGCGPLWPETWERSARDAWARLETAHDELIAERERNARLEQAAREVLRISDRKHDAWDALRTALGEK